MATETGSISSPPPAPAGGSTPSVLANPRVQGLLVLGIMMALLMGALDQFVVLTALNKILSELGQPNGGPFVVSAYVIASTTAIPIFAKLSDILSRRNVFLGGLAIFIVGSILSGLSQNLSELIAFRAVQGFGSGGFFPVGIAIVAVSFPPETRARITGFLSGVFGIATVAGPLLGSFIVDNFSWRWIFYVNIPIGLIGSGILLYSVGPLRPVVRRRFDIPGAALLAAWVGSLMFPLIQVSDAGWAWSDPRVIAPLVAAVVLAAIFVVFELRTREPLVPLRLLLNRVVAACGGTTFLVGFVFFPLTTFVSLFVGSDLAHLGLSAADVVRDVLYAMVIPLVFGAAIGGQLLTRTTYRNVVLLGLAIALVGLVFLTRVTNTTPTWVLAFGFLPVGGLVLVLIPLGFGIGLTFPVFLLAVQNEVPLGDVGEASGLVQFLQSLGGSIGLALLTVFQQNRLAAVDPSPDASCLTMNPNLSLCGGFLQKLPTSLATAYDQTFEVMLVFFLVAVVVALTLRGRLPTGKRPAP